MQYQYVVTEGKIDQAILQNLLLGQGNPELKIMSAGGYSAVLSQASTLLSYWQKNVFIVADADSTEQDQVQERRAFIQSYLSQFALDNIFQVELFEPVLERIFFEDKTIAEKIAGKPLDDLLIDLAKENPIATLKQLHKTPKDVLALLDESDYVKLRQLPQIQRLISYLA